jgi:hypothetical protein
MNSVTYLVLFFWLTAFFVVNVASPVNPHWVECPWPECSNKYVPATETDEHHKVHIDGCGLH